MVDTEYDALIDCFSVLSALHRHTLICVHNLLWNLVLLMVPIFSLHY